MIWFKWKVFYNSALLGTILETKMTVNAHKFNPLSLVWVVSLFLKIAYGSTENSPGVAGTKINSNGDFESRKGILTPYDHLEVRYQNYCLF